MAEVHAATQEPFELSHLTRFEQGIASKWFTHWSRQLAARHPASVEDNHRKALNLAHISVARVWLAIGSPTGFVSVCLWVLRDGAWQFVLAAGLTAIALLAFTFMAVRWKQSRQYWPSIVNPRE